MFCVFLCLKGRSELMRLTQTPPVRGIFFGLLVGQLVVFAVFAGLNESKMDKKKIVLQKP